MGIPVGLGVRERVGAGEGSGVGSGAGFGIVCTVGLLDNWRVGSGVSPKTSISRVGFCVGLGVSARVDDRDGRGARGGIFVFVGCIVGMVLVTSLTSPIKRLGDSVGRIGLFWGLWLAWVVLSNVVKLNPPGATVGPASKGAIATGELVVVKGTEEEDPEGGLKLGP